MELVGLAVREEAGVRDTLVLALREGLPLNNAVGEDEKEIVAFEV